MSCRRARAFVAAVGSSRPTDGTSPNSRFSTTKTQASSADHRADLVADDRAERRRRSRPRAPPPRACRAGAARPRRRRANSAMPRPERIAEPDPEREPLADHGERRSRRACSRRASRSDDARAARREEERRPDRPEAVLARDDEHAGERGEDGGEAADPEQVALVLLAGSARAGVAEEAGQQHEQQHERDHRRATSPSVVRVERIFSSSARVCAITAPAPRSARGRPARATSPASRARAGRSRRRRRSRRRVSLAAPRDEQRAVAVGGRRRCPRARAPRRSAASCGLRTRTAPPTRAVSSSSGDSVTSRPRLMIRTLVDRLRDLGQHVARDEHRPAARRERAQEVAQPAHAFRVEPVRRLVEHEQLRLAEQRGGEPEPLPHAERVALDAPVGGRRRARRAAAPRRPASRAARRRARACSRWLRPERPGWKSVASSTAPTRSAGCSSSA